MLVFSKTKSQLKTRNNTMSDTVVELKNLTKLGNTQTPLRENLPSVVTKKIFHNALTLFRKF